MSVLTERVYRSIHLHDLLPPGSRALVAASGGADSTALVHLLSELAPAFGFEVVGLVHFNHGLRGAASDADEAFCKDLAAELSVAFECGRDDVAAAARRLGTSIEDAGRQLRHAFFAEAATRAEATHVALGHTRDDQAETVLLNLLRGSGPRGEGGMCFGRGRLVRPLLECSHEELVAWLHARDRPFREDESNRDLRFARNRIRHEVLPVLRRVAPHAPATLARAAQIAAADADYLDQVATEALEALTSGQVAAGPRTDDELCLDVQGLLQLPVAIARRVALAALSRMSGGRSLGFDHADRLLALASGHAGRAASFPGQQVERHERCVRLRRSVGRVALAPGQSRRLSSAVNSLRASLSTPGEVLIGSLVVSSDVRPWAGGSAKAEVNDPFTALVDASRVSDLAVRFRRPGDAFRPLGLGGRKKLQDLFVDRKVPRPERDRIPLVVDGRDRIVWVAGHAISEDFRVSEGTRAVVILKLRGERV